MESFINALKQRNLEKIRVCNLCMSGLQDTSWAICYAVDTVVHRYFVLWHIYDCLFGNSRYHKADSLALIGVYGSVATGDEYGKSDLDLMILINDENGQVLADGFIIDDVDIGYDLYCTSWDMLENDAQCGHAHLPRLFDSMVVYCKDKSALKRLDQIRRKAAGRNDVYSSFMNLLSLQWMFYEIAECIAVDGFEIMDKFNPKNLEENVDAFDQALNKYLAEYEKVGICPKHFENIAEFVEDYNKKIFEDI